MNWPDKGQTLVLRNKLMIKKLLLTMGTLGLLVSCAKEEFVANKAINKSEINAVTAYENRLCAQYSYNRPDLDVLILWDNSTSGFAISDASKTALKNLIKVIASERYNFNLMISPIVGDSQKWLMTTADSTLSSSSVAGTVVYKGADQLNNFISNFSIPTSSLGGSEQGALRATQILNSYPNVFRKNAYTHVMVISNGDDFGCSIGKGYECPDGSSEQANYISKLEKKLLCLRGNYSGYTSLGCGTSDIAISNKLDAKSFRFISVTAGRPGCSGHSGYVYKTLSQTMKSTFNESGEQIMTDSSTDNYNICDSNFTMFSSLATDLKSTIDYHKYEYWPVASANQEIDLESLIVKGPFGILNEVSSTSTLSGYSLYNVNSAGDDLVPTTKDTRFYPSSGEPFYGKLIKLHGSAQTLAGGCINVYFTEKKTSYGYIYLTSGKPSESTITVKYKYKSSSSWITIPKSATNGWTYIEVPSLADLTNTTNLAIVNRPSNSAIPGHLIKLNGTYQFDNNGQIEFYVDYIPASASN